MSTTRYGVKLVSYRGQTMNMFVFEGERYEASFEEAVEKKDEYQARNPDGYYVVEELTD